MEEFFAKTFSGAPFSLFGSTHLAILLVLALFNFGLLRFKGASESTRSKVRLTLAIVLWANESAWHLWKYAIGEWTMQEMLPLHLCSVLIWLAGFMLLFKNQQIYAFVYFLGIGGGINALLTPDVGIYGFPHFRFFQTFISHGLLVSAAIYMTAVEGFRPTWKSLGRVLVGVNVFMVIVFFINKAIGSNYLFVVSKPATASLLDLLPAWPWYILWMEVLGAIISVLLLLPFLLKDRKGSTA